MIQTAGKTLGQNQNISVNTDSVTSAEQLKILSWNIYLLPYLSLFNGNIDRVKHISEELKDSKYQIIAFQEAFSSVCRGILSKELKENYPYQYGPINGKHAPLKTNSGLWIVSKIPLTKLDEISFSESKSFDMVARKGAAIFQGKYKGADFQIAITHLQAENQSGIRQNQIKDIKEKLLDKYYSPITPQIICGDFNIEMDDKQDYNFMLSMLDAKNGDIKGDKTTYDEVYNTLSQERTGKRKTIDYVLVRNLQWIKKIERTVNPFYKKDKKYTGNLSDHYGMEANVIFLQDNSHNIAWNN